MKTFQQIGEEIGELVERKNAAYGDSISKSGEFLRLLYPGGLCPEQYDDALLLARTFDKQMRIANHHSAFGESPYADLCGYGILGVHMHQQKEASITWQDNASDPDAGSPSKAQRGSAATSTEEKTRTSASAAAATAPSPRPSGCCARTTSAPVPIATATASQNAAARAERRRNAKHTYSLWLARHNVGFCIACGSQLSGMEDLVVTVRAAKDPAYLHPLHVCSTDCLRFCISLLASNQVEGATL